MCFLSQIHSLITFLFVANGPVQRAETAEGGGRMSTPKQDKKQNGSATISDLVSPFSSARLRPIRQRTRNAIVSHHHCNWQSIVEVNCSDHSHTIAVILHIKHILSSGEYGLNQPPPTSTHLGRYKRDNGFGYLNHVE